MMHLITKHLTPKLRHLAIIASCAIVAGCSTAPTQSHVVTAKKIAVAPENINLLYCDAMSASNCHASLASELCCAHVSLFKRGDTMQMVLPKRYFFSQENPSQILPERIPTLAGIAHMLVASYPEAPVTVIGYSDNIGSRPQRMAASDRMARSITAYLWNNGVSNDRLQTLAKGAQNPIATNDTLIGRFYNQRVEIHVGLK